MMNLLFCFFLFFFFSNWGSSLLSILFVLFVLLILSQEYYITKVSLYSEIDYLSNGLIVLSFWVIFLCFISSQKVKNKLQFSFKFNLLLLLLLFFLLMSFSFNNFLLFYIGFECSIIPVLILILGWGYQPERVQAGFYLIFYTLFASLPLLAVVLSGFYLKTSSMLMYDFFTKPVYSVVNLFIMGAFLVKFPMYLTHLWLPKAHVEAPVAGSMILAGVLLKLGGYGIIRFLVLSDKFPLFLQSLLIFFSIWGGFVVSLTCLSQIDMKSLIAYSSVVHMSVCISCLLVLSDTGKQGAILMMISHGLCSSGLFFLTGVIYSMTNSRSLLVNKGLVNLTPSLGLWWFLLLACNMACPPTINLLSEILLLSAMLSWSYLMYLPLVLLIFFSCVYSIYLFSLSQHGKFFLAKQSLNMGYCVDFFILFLHWLPLNFFILFVGFII